MNVVDEAIRQWEAFRAGVIAELEQIPEEQWEFRPCEGARTVRALAYHLLQSGAGFTRELLRDDGSFANLFRADVREEIRRTLPEAKTRAEIIEALRGNGAENARKLREAGESLASRQFASLAGPQSRLTALNFAAAHEQYHRGQIAMIARILGRTPALTKQIEKLSG